MRTYLFTTKQNTVVVEVETDAISNTQDNSTIHDVNVLKGDFSKLQSNGFNINTLSGISYIQMKTLATSLGMSLTVINTETKTSTGIITAGTFAISTATITGWKEATAISTQITTANGCGKVIFTEKTDAELPVGLVISESGLITGETDETGEVTFTIVATDSLGQVVEKAYTTTIGALSTANAITEFTIPNQTGSSTINAGAHTVAVTMPFGTNVTALAPTITLSAGATVSPLSGAATDFTNPVIYTVTAEDGETTQDWTVTVTVAAE